MTHDEAHRRLTATHGQGQHVRIHDHELPSQQLRGEGIEDAARFQHVDRGRGGQPEALAVRRDQLLQQRELSLRHEHAVAAYPSDRDRVGQECGEGKQHHVKEDGASRRGIGERQEPQATVDEQAHEHHHGKQYTFAGAHHVIQSQPTRLHWQLPSERSMRKRE